MLLRNAAHETEFMFGLALGLGRYIKTKANQGEHESS